MYRKLRAIDVGMERSGYVVPIREGGTGVAFKTPESLLYEEPRMSILLVK